MTLPRCQRLLVVVLKLSERYIMGVMDIEEILESLWCRGEALR